MLISNLKFQCLRGGNSRVFEQLSASITPEPPQRAATAGVSGRMLSSAAAIHGQERTGQNIFSVHEFRYILSQAGPPRAVNCVVSAAGMCTTRRLWAVVVPHSA